MNKQIVDKYYKALKDSFIKTTFSGKFYLSFLAFAAILFSIWKYQMQLEWYDNAHGVISNVDHRARAITYITFVTLTTAKVYFFLVIKGAKKHL